VTTAARDLGARSEALRTAARDLGGRGEAR
jgi:hypothetical protein